jgi:hypothetical protein
MRFVCEYEASWRDLRRRELFLGLVALTYIPGVLLTSLVLDAFPSPSSAFTALRILPEAQA